MPIFDLLSATEVKIFENNANDIVRARKLLKKSSYTQQSNNEFTVILKKMVTDVLKTENVDFKKSIEVIGSKVRKCFATKGIYENVAPNFLILSKNISAVLSEPEDDLPPLLDYSSGEESECEQSQGIEASPDMSAFGEVMLAEGRSGASTSSASSQVPRAASVRSPTPRAHGTSRRDRSRSPRADGTSRRDRTRSPRAPQTSVRSDRSRSPREQRGEKPKKKRSPSPISVVECVTSVGRDEDKPRIVNKSHAFTLKAVVPRTSRDIKGEEADETRHASNSRSSVKSEDGGDGDIRLASSSRSISKPEEGGAGDTRGASRKQKRECPFNQLTFTLQKSIEGTNTLKLLPIKSYFFSSRRSHYAPGF